MSFWSQALEITRTDLRIERRVGLLVRVIIPFAVVSLLVFPLTLGLDMAAIELAGPAVFWALGILFGMQVTLRQAAFDAPERRDLYALAGLDPAAKFAGRVLSGSVLMIGFLAALFLAMLILYDPRLPPGWVLPSVLATLLMAAGLTELGTLAGEVTAGLSNRTSLASLIVVPLAIPLVIGASQTLESIDRGASILPWILLLLASDLALAVAGVGLARPLEEATR